jgi:hypothetical protein
MLALYFLHARRLNDTVNYVQQGNKSDDYTSVDRSKKNQAQTVQKEE